ncbi:MAG: J domain-containing protein [bacterium]|nr:MAG: J domain-containing protein [bacterium]
MIKDYYEILGVSPNCTQEEIKKAYRKLARDSHPDSCGKEDSTEFFEVQEAYEAIGEKSKRNQYDKTRQLEQKGAQNIPTYSLHSNEPGFAYPSSFENYFNRILNRFLGLDPFMPRPDSLNQALELILTPEEARTGGVIPVKFPIRQLCPICRGKGSNLFFFCDHCGGSGSTMQTIVIKIEIPPRVANLSQYNISIPGYGVLNITVIIR